MRSTLLTLVCSAPLAVAAQTFAIGRTDLDFYDADREREVDVRCYYPAEQAGVDEPFAAGAFPVLILGHGYLMDVGAYQNISDHFVPLGYILVLPTTEGGLLPDHEAFGQDMTYLAFAIQNEGQDLLSPLFGHVQEATALMGHSMGGGASMLAAAANTTIRTVVNFAAAETNPSAIAASAQVLVPTLLFAGSADCVTPPATNQQYMYDALEVPCKALVNITGGNHCWFANNNLTCNLGETALGCDFGTTRAAQHDVLNDFATLWLDHYLKDSVTAYATFLDSCAQSTRVAVQSVCLSTSTAQQGTGVALSVWPSPAQHRVYWSGAQQGARLDVLDAYGHLVKRTNAGSTGDMAVNDLPPGLYWMCFSGTGREQLPLQIMP
jgi:dienelactone hydrolase